MTSRFSIRKTEEGIQVQFELSKGEAIEVANGKTMGRNKCVVPPGTSHLQYRIRKGKAPVSNWKRIPLPTTDKTEKASAVPTSLIFETA